MINHSTGKPIWLGFGWRGNGTTAATYALFLWWKEFGKLFGSRPFGVIVEIDDHLGWEQCRILEICPEPKPYKKVFHYRAWKKLLKAKRIGERIKPLSIMIGPTGSMDMAGSMDGASGPTGTATTNDPSRSIQNGPSGCPGPPMDATSTTTSDPNRPVHNGPTGNPNDSSGQ